MDNREKKTGEKRICIGVCAHVDAGKTTLSESMLYLSGKIRKLGRVDNKDAYLDTYALERDRGITIFSKQATMDLNGLYVTLLDTPGHVDFSAEMERTLQVLDYAILVVSGADGIQGHTKTLWRRLKMYHVPVFLFVNKMDQDGTDQGQLMAELKKGLDDRCIVFGEDDQEVFYDELAMCNEALMHEYLEEGKIEEAAIKEAIKNRTVFPCFFGSALKLEGIEAFMAGMAQYIEAPVCPDEFGAKVFKIARDEQGNRLTYMKITGGSLKVKDILKGISNKEGGGFEEWEEKVNQIRIYSGQKFDTVNEAQAGMVCSVLGLTKTSPGEGLGIEKTSNGPILEPVLAYRMILPADCNPRIMLPKLRQIEEEEPELHIVWNEHLQEIQVQIMGEVQIEILQSLIKERFDTNVTFDDGAILYKETIATTVEGVGHFEPLRHYAEVHLLLEPGEMGSGLQFASNCSEDILEKNWQRLILTHLEEKVHRGVLTGSPITDMKITLVAGRAHKKHTEGGDFREATYRAVRQGLREAESILLEPFYAFSLEVPENMVGRAMMDVEKMGGQCEITHSEDGMTTLTGSGPVVTMRNYQKDVVAYTKGHGRLFSSLKGYAPCHNQDEIVAAIGYDAERDLLNPTGSVFCAHGAGFLVDWDEVKDYMHVESCLQPERGSEEESSRTYKQQADEEAWIGLEEIDQIISRTFYANQGEKSVWKKRKTAQESYYENIKSTPLKNDNRVAYLLVDGYNIIYAWPDLHEIAKDNMDGARIKLLECLCNYQGIRKCEVIVVFDAYRIQGHRTEVLDYHNIHVVYTKEAETADRYIEKFAHTNGQKYAITVATSDGLEQVIIRGAGCRLLSARELKEETTRLHEQMMTDYHEKQPDQRHYLSDTLDPALKQKLDTLHQDPKA